MECICHVGAALYRKVQKDVENMISSVQFEQVGSIIIIGRLYGDFCGILCLYECFIDVGTR